MWQRDCCYWVGGMGRDEQCLELGRGRQRVGYGDLVVGNLVSWSSLMTLTNLLLLLLPLPLPLLLPLLPWWHVLYWRTICVWQRMTLQETELVLRDVV